MRKKNHWNISLKKLFDTMGCKHVHLCFTRYPARWKKIKNTFLLSTRTVLSSCASCDSHAAVQLSPGLRTHDVCQLLVCVFCVNLWKKNQWFSTSRNHCTLNLYKTYANLALSEHTIGKLPIPPGQCWTFTNTAGSLFN